ncbi:NADPH-adrenodoxin reductase [Coemansia sp. RSA 2049]|nr:NADPH-adrenodoxin reductase [Coemansia sp. RSA 1939]KAJ2522088.1 NADPH-adrenodoxin reductase [Coemansia sp. RSA 2049]KAJ2617168.1 NADPH-adrenodoxin reductase [Coemansia sp. RSA 1804]KAJ2693245.1 NADPH-adrenodoxin reductase [Coemansia sp. RSA 1285]
MASVALLCPRRIWCAREAARSVVGLRGRRGHATDTSTHTSPLSEESREGGSKHVAIVGGGAAGFYTAARLLAKTQGSNKVLVDIFEQLPTPHGLVRYGVAPDHPEVKNCMSKFRDVAEDRRVRYFGNVKIGGSGGGDGLTLQALQSVYDGVVLAYGASRDKKLGIPGEDGSGDRTGVLSARRFVAWYNGLPAAQDLRPDLESFDKIVIIGHGNVALDCARMLLTDPDVLATTDITAQALGALRRSRIRHVEMVGRRGPLQVSFTTKELREMTKIPGLRIVSDVALISDQCASEAGVEYLAKSRPLKRMMDLLLKHAVPPSAGGGSCPGTAADEGAGKSFELSFLRSPVQVLFDQKWDSSNCGNDSASATATTTVPQVLRLQKNTLEGPPDAARAQPTGEFVDVPCAMVLRSIGYASTPIEGAPFDSRRRIVPNIGGRAIDANGELVPRLYVAGWLKRGPIGVIATTMQDAYRTADAVAVDMANDAEKGPRCVSRAVIDARLAELGLDKATAVTNADWKKLEAYEIENGSRLGKPREKVPSVQDMLHVIRS